MLDTVANGLGGRTKLQSNREPDTLNLRKMENCLSTSFRMSVNVATLGLSLIELSSLFHAFIAFSLRVIVQFDAASSFKYDGPVFALTHCGNILTVIVQSEGRHTYAGTLAQTWSRMRTKYSPRS